MKLSKIARAYEDVWLDDPEENPDSPHWRVPFDDASIETYLAKVSSAIDRARDNERMAREAATDEERRAANEAQARLIKRTVAAFIGTEGWDEMLRWLGGGEAVDPADYIRVLGEVFAAFLDMLGRYCTSAQLRACGMRYEREADRAREAGRRKGKKKRKGGGR